MRLDIAKKAFEDVGFILFDRFIAKYNELLAKEDPEAWREENRKKQAAGVRFEMCWMDGTWHFGVYDFAGNKEDYREVPQEHVINQTEIRKWADRYYSLWCFVENSLPKGMSTDIFRRYAKDVNLEIYGIQETPPTPHAKERALWKAQREAGTNEVWQVSHSENEWIDLSHNEEPNWHSDFTYRVKPKTVKYYRVTIEFTDTEITDHLLEGNRFGDYTIIGNIEEREVEVG